MNLYSFIASITQSLIWPCLIVFLIWYFHNYGNQILKFIKSIKYKDFSIEFTEGLKELKELEKREAIQEASDKSINKHNEVRSYSNIKGSSVGEVLKTIPKEKHNPIDLVVSSFKVLELSIISAAKRLSLEKGNLSNYMIKFYEKNLISSSDLAIFQKLKKLRDDLIHSIDTEISNSEAGDYSEICTTLYWRIDRLGVTDINS